jgi:hypothetical protein
VTYKRSVLFGAFGKITGDVIKTYPASIAIVDEVSCLVEGSIVAGLGRFLATLKRIVIFRDTKQLCAFCGTEEMAPTVLNLLMCTLFRLQRTGIVPTVLNICHPDIFRHSSELIYRDGTGQRFLLSRRPFDHSQRFVRIDQGSKYKQAGSVLSGNQCRTRGMSHRQGGGLPRPTCRTFLPSEISLRIWWILVVVASLRSEFSY